MDALSAILGAIRLRGALYFEVHAAEPWASVPPSNRSVSAAGLEPGDILLFSRGRGEQAVFVCGYLCCDAGPFNPLLGALPPMLIVRPRAEGVELTRNLIRAALDESDHGATGSGDFGWLSALRDERVARALHLIHTRPTEHWSLASLAEASAASRSRLAGDFHHFTGESPMRYLARWRMQLAAGMLHNSAASIAQVAERVGYESEAAFKRTFKKFVGSPPGRWRRAMRTSHVPVAFGEPGARSRTTAH